jgi:hypothetical protein
MDDETYALRQTVKDNERTIARLKDNEAALRDAITAHRHAISVGVPVGGNRRADLALWEMLEGNA